MNTSGKQKKVKNLRSSLYIHTHLCFTDTNVWMLINIGGIICPKRMKFTHGITVEFTNTSMQDHTK